MSTSAGRVDAQGLAGAEAPAPRGSGHQAISYCPYCAEETLFPLERGWECRSCLRAFSVSFLGLTSREGSA